MSSSSGNFSDDDVLTFLNNILKSVTNDLDHALVESLFPTVENDDKNVRAIWLRVFKPSIYSTTDNYERLENLGDTLLKTYFRAFLFYYNESYTEADITNISSYYMATKGQAYVTKKLGLTRYITFPVFNKLPEDERVKNEMFDAFRDGIAADIYESFIGAVGEVSSTLIGLGVSEILCSNIMRKIYTGDRAIMPIDESHRQSNVMTLVTQWLEGLGVPSSGGAKTNQSGKKMFVERTGTDGTPGGVKYFDVALDENQTRVLEEVTRVKFADPRVGYFHVTVVRNEGYKERAYRDIRGVLEQNGVNQVSVDSVRYRHNMNRIEGYDMVEVVSPKKLSYKGSPGYAVYQLVGTRPGGSKVILFTGAYDDRHFLNGGRAMTRDEILDEMIGEYRKLAPSVSSRMRS